MNQNLESLCEEIVNTQIEGKYKELIERDLEYLCKEAVQEELENWAEMERKAKRVESPSMKNKTYRQHAMSAKQLPITISRIDESVEEESPEALPHHQMPPQSFVDGRSSVLHSESNYETQSNDERKFRFSAEPKQSANKINGEKVFMFRESKQDRLRDYLKDKFRPPSDQRSESKRSGSIGSIIQ